MRRLKSSLLYRYLASYMGIALLGCATVCMMLFNVSVRQLNVVNRNVVQEKLTNYADDLDIQYRNMEAAVVTVSSSAHFKERFISKRPYNELIMLKEFQRLNGKVLLADDFYLIYHNKPYVYRSSEKKSDLEVWLREIGADETFFKKVLETSRFAVFSVQSRFPRLFFCFPITVDIQTDSETGCVENLYATLIFDISEKTMRERFTMLAGELDGELSLYSTIGGNVENFVLFHNDKKNTEQLEASSASGRFRIEYAYANPYFSLSTLSTANIVALVFIVIFLIAVAIFFAYMNFRPIQRVAEAMNRTAENLPNTLSENNRNELENILYNFNHMFLDYSTLYRTAQDAESTIRSQYTMMKRQILRLLLHGDSQTCAFWNDSQEEDNYKKDNPKGIDVSFMDIRLPGPLFCVMLIRIANPLVESKKEQLIRQIERFSDDELHLYCTEAPETCTNATNLAIISSMTEISLLDDAKEYVELALNECFLPREQAGDSVYSLAVSSPYDSLFGLPTALEEAKEGLERPDPGDNENQIECGMLIVDSTLQKRMLTACKLGDIQEARNCAERILEKLHIKQKSIAVQRYIFYRLWDEICEVAGVGEVKISDSRTRELLAAGSFEQLKNCLISLINYVGTALSFNEDMMAEEPNVTEKEAENILTFLNENFTDTELTLEVLATRFHLNARRVSMLIKSNIGMNYQDYLTSLRIGYAQKLLLSGKDLSVTEICACSGYSNLPHFVRTFKRVTGFTPTRFQKHHELPL